MSAKRMSVQCPNCRNVVNAIIHTVIDPADDPEAKMRLLSGSLNTIRCSNCGAPVVMATPVLYHDAAKELLIAYVPMELNMPRQQQDKAIGDLMREVTGKLPKEQMKGYLFQPKQALTLPGLIEMVLQADGITPEMLEDQKARARMVEIFIQAPDDELPALVQQYDEQLDGQFFSTMTLMAQRLVQEGRAELAEQVMQTQQMVVAFSSFGKQLVERARLQEQVVADVSAQVQALMQATETDGSDPRQQLFALAQSYGDDEDRLQALVGLVRPIFDYAFFQELTMRIGQAPADERDSLTTMREKLLQITALVDQQAQMAVQESANFLRALLQSPDPEPLLVANMDMIDDTFMAVLQANIQEADKQGDADAGAKLKDLYNRVVNLLRQNMQPELRFINELLSMPTDDAARQVLAEEGAQYGAVLLEMMDAVENILESRGDEGILDRLSLLREDAEEMLQ